MNSSEDISGRLDLKGSFALLSETDQESFWRFASRDAVLGRAPKGVPRADGSPYDGLCAAVEDLERKGGSKPRLSQLPRIVRRLSTDELSRAVLRLRGRLLQDQYAEPALSRSFCRWVQVAKRPALVAGLKALGCDCDSTGALLGDISHCDAELARQQLIPLIEDHGAYDLSVVCAGLMVNHERWAFLWRACQSLSEVASNSLGAVQPGALEPSENLSTVPAATIGALTAAANAPQGVATPADFGDARQPDLSSIKEGASNLAQMLQRAAEGMALGRIAPPQEPSALWADLHKRFLFACTALGVQGSQSITELEEVVLKNAGSAERESTADVILRLRYLSGPGNRPADYLLNARSQAEEVVGRLRRGELEVRDEVVRSALALIELVDGQAGLGPQEAFDLFAEASRSFGPQVAHAASRGSLHFETEPASPIESEGARPTEEQPLLEEPAEPPTDVPMLSSGEGATEVVAVSSSSDSAKSGPEQTASASGIGPVAVPQESAPGGAPEFEAASQTSLGEQPIGERMHTAAPPAPVEHSAPPQLITPVAQSFETFLTLHWLDGKGNVAPVPWLTDEFIALLSARAHAAWDAGEFGLAGLFASAASLRGGQVELEAGELIAAAKLLSQPDDFVLARNDHRLAAIRASASRHSPLSGALSLTLEALAPTLPTAVTGQEIDSLVAAAGYSTPILAEVVTFLLTGWVGGTDPVQLLRAELESTSAADPAFLQAQLQTSQRRLQEVVATLYSAAGGRIQRTHCRRAWSEFVAKHVAPLRTELAPLATEKSQPHRASKDVRSRVIELGRAFQRIMEAAGVKHQDLAVAVAAAEQIVTAVQDVVDSKVQLEQAARRGPTVNLLPVESLCKLMTDLPSHGSDRLSALLLRARISRQTQPNPVLIPASLLTRRPSLLGTLHPEFLVNTNVVDGIPIDAFSDQVAAAALLVDVDISEAEEPKPVGQFTASLRDAVANSARIELLGALAPTSALQPHERSQLHKRALELGDETYNQAIRLQRAWLACDELVHPNAAQFGAIASAALIRCNAELNESPLLERILLAEWVSQQVAAVEVARREIVEVRIRQAATRSAALAKEVETELIAHRYQAAMALLDPSLPPPEAAGGRARRTMWRSEGLERFQRPIFSLEHEHRSANSVANHLTRTWAATATDLNHPDKDSIRRSFYEVVSGEASLSQANRRNRFAVKLPDLRDHQQRKTVIKCAALRDYFRRAKLNPSFLPQLHEYRQLVLVHAGLRGAENPVDIVSKNANQEGTGTLCIFLEPGIPIAKRDDVMAALRRRGVNAAVIDDVDLCRLLFIQDDVEGHNFIPFLEIVFEQLDLEAASPFSSLDGQHVRMETFVGRATAANKVAMTSSYTRLFSGRKLGKSAFLRYIAHSFDGEKTPSKNTLTVIFITIAGGESEGWVVDCIINEMNKRFDLPMETEDARRFGPADRYAAFARRFGERKPSDNVLLILDEADAFIDGQLRAYDKGNREGSLSFRMMKESSAGTDSAQMPRIRLLFSGYRVTNTRGGVWANAGDVLILQPLEEEEAADFLRGMLGRVGVDIGDHAPFAARRCGYQPAVLIRFGETLLRRLKRNSRAARRETHVVSYDDVQATMAEQPVVDEIRTVVNNNFQGNRVAATIFAATLLALKDLQPGMSLEDGPSQVLAKLAEIDADLDWLKRFGPQPVAQIERQLQEFIDRELLSVTDSTRFGAREYRLKFSHFLPVLTQHADLTNEIRLHIQHLRAGAGSNRLIESVLPDASLDASRYWHRQKTANECAFVVIGGQWPDALVDPKVGVPDRLGINDAQVVDGSASSDFGMKVKRGERVFKRVSAECWGQFTHLACSRPLTLLGGIDLVRAARLCSLDGQDFGRPVEIIGLGRLSEATVVWWFDVVRSLHFTSPDAAARIYAATAGIPLLVRELDRLLPQALSADVTASELQTALRTLEEGMPSIARQLTDGDNTEVLTSRELELLKMTFHVGAELETEFDLGQDFPLLWELVADAFGATIRPPLTDTGDQVALQTLIDAGLIEVSARAATRGGSALGRVQLGAADPVRRLLSSLGPIGAG